MSFFRYYIHPNHTGDVTSAGDGATTIANHAVTNAKLANMAQATIKGRQAAAGTGDPEDLTAAQARTAMGIATSDNVVFGGLAVGAAPVAAGNIRVGTSTRYANHQVIQSASLCEYRIETAHEAGTARHEVRLFRTTNTSDLVALILARGNNTATNDVQIASGVNNSYLAGGGGNVQIGGTTFGTTAARTLHLANGTAPTTFPTAGIFAEGGEVKVWDTSGNITTISDHPVDQAVSAGVVISDADTMPHVYYTMNVYTGFERFEYRNPSTGDTQTVIRRKPNFTPRDWDADQESIRQQTIAVRKEWECEKSECLAKAEQVARDAVAEKRELTEDEAYVVNLATGYTEPPPLYKKRQPPKWLEQRIDAMKAKPNGR